MIKKVYCTVILITLHKLDIMNKATDYYNNY